MKPAHTTRIAVIGALLAMLVTASAAASEATTRPRTAAPARVHAGTAPTEPGAYVALPPTRIVDTATGLGGWSAFAPGITHAVLVMGVGGVPSLGVVAVLLNVTAASPERSGYVVVYPEGQPRGVSSMLNFTAHQTTANLVLAPVGSYRSVAVKNASSGSTRLVVDVEGYVLAGTAVTPGAIVAQPARRALDTGSGTTALAPRGVFGFFPRGSMPNPAVSAAFVNLTADPTAAGYLTAYATGSVRPPTSNVNFLAYRSTANLILTRLSAEGSVSVYNGSGAATRVVADNQGYLVSGTPTEPGTIQPVTPARIVDTGSGLGAPRSPLAGQHSLDVTVLGHGGIPTTGVSAVVLNVTAASPQASGYLTAYPSGTVRPTASTVNFGAGRAMAGLVVVPVGADGKVTLYSGSSGSIRLVVDVQGYVLGG
jgi:hypothetical protein